MEYNDKLVQSGDVDGAFEFFSLMLERNVRSWMVMIAGYVQCGKPKEAIHLFMEMEEARLWPNEVTVVAVRSACADLGDLDSGRRVS